jgi:hypothetical protein
MGDSTILRDGIFTHPTLAESLNSLFMAMDSDSESKTQRSTIFDPYTGNLVPEKQSGSGCLDG